MDKEFEQFKGKVIETIVFSEMYETTTIFFTDGTIFNIQGENIHLICNDTYLN